MSLTTDKNDPRLGHGEDISPVPQNEVYLVLSEEERAKGFIRPVRTSYKHVGVRPKYSLRDLDEKESSKYAREGYVKYEEYPESERPICGRFWSEKELNSGCGSVTTMGIVLAETYARNPKFYGSTYCCGCRMHLKVEEFVWDRTNEVVGS